MRSDEIYGLSSTDSSPVTNPRWEFSWIYEYTNKILYNSHHTDNFRAIECIVTQLLAFYFHAKKLRNVPIQISSCQSCIRDSSVLIGHASPLDETRVLQVAKEVCMAFTILNSLNSITDGFFKLMFASLFLKHGNL